MRATSQTFVDILRERAVQNANQLAYTFLPEGIGLERSLTWSQLHRRAAALSILISAQGAAGQPVLLMLPSGLEFIEALFACWYSGAIAVPISVPRHHRVKQRLHGLLEDCGARFAIGAAATRSRMETDQVGLSDAALTWIEATGAETDTPPLGPNVRPEQAALLQYTSGSTGTPRGVVVTHANLMNNSATIAQACGHRFGQTIGGWLPLFHDMGLVGVLQAAYCGARCVFMPPERFLMRPALWLQMICDYQIVSSPAPNFAYDLCVDKVGDEQKAQLNLRHWRNALNGSEPVRAATLHRFAETFAACGFDRSAFFPCYGLAEATLFVTGPCERRQIIIRTAQGEIASGDSIKGHVGCGGTWGDTQMAIVDPHTSKRVAGQQIGEIWISGGSCAAGYWKNPDATQATFQAGLSSQEPLDRNTVWLRTGDLGMFIEGNLFITGRLRELIVLAGRNHFPVDLERTAENAHYAIAPSGVAAFSIEVDQVERLIIAAEVRRELAGRGKSKAAIDAKVINRLIRAAIAAEHDITPYDIILLRPGALPRTTSGKLNRLAARDGYLNQTLEKVQESEDASIVQ